MKAARQPFLDLARGYAIAVMLYGHLFRMVHRYPYVEEGMGGAVQAMDGNVEFFARALRNHVTLIFFLLVGYLIGQRSRHIAASEAADGLRRRLLERGLALLCLDFVFTNLGRTFASTGQLGFEFIRFEPLAFIGACCVFYAWAWKWPLKLQFLFALAGFALVELCQSFPAFPAALPARALRYIFFDAGDLNDFFRFRFPFFGWLPVAVAGFALGTLTFKRAFFLKLSGAAALLFLPVHLLYARFRPLYQGEVPDALSWLLLRRFPPAADWLLFNFALALFVLTGFSLLAEKSKFRESLLGRALNILGTASLFVFLVHPFLIGLIKIAAAPYFTLPTESTGAVLGYWLVLLALGVCTGKIYLLARARWGKSLFFRFV